GKRAGPEPAFFRPARAAARAPVAGKSRLDPRKAANAVGLYSAPMIKAARKPAQNLVLELARKVLAIEADAVRALIDRVDERFLAAVTLILERRGRVVVSGIGKSGHIARK